MVSTHQPLFSETFLRSVWGDEFKVFQNSEAEAQLIGRLRKWTDKKFQKETSAEGTFVDVFFKQTWGFIASGEASKEEGYSCWPQFPVEGAGQGGGTGTADLGLGWFDHPTLPPTPQILCEFKDIRSNLDARQNRKGNTRSPVKQCADYLREAGKELFGNEVIQPNWGIVTDMNEFRLYWRNTMPAQFQRFVIQSTTIDDAVSLLDESERASFQRFLFLKLFHAEQLLTAGGPPPLRNLIFQQWVRERDIENDFYKEYRAYRERLYVAIRDNNKDFSGSKGRLVRLAQKLIDRCIFVLFCEDMGQELSFPPNALRDYLSHYSKDPYYDEGGQEVWDMLGKLFIAMDRGEKFLSHPINRFNGGLFAADPELDGLMIPNQVFCERFQGESEETLRAKPETLLYFSGMYNFGVANGKGHAITLYTLGRIFEQSITELEVLEAEAEGRLSLTKETKRKRDGVYYTPEWVVQHIVEETVGTRLQEIRDELGWSIEIEGDDELVRQQKELPPSKHSKAFGRHVDAVKEYRDRLNRFSVLDPACGSGAFLIHTMEYLLGERKRVSAEIARVTRLGEGLFEFNSETEIRTILSRNIYGVDINPASVEITSLSLWLHTAKPDQALCDLDENVKDGNSLIGPAFYDSQEQFQLWPEEKREQVNAFDWEREFPKVFDEAHEDGPGFDCIVGNPPYVKLQNFRKVYSEMAQYLKDAKLSSNQPLYVSTQRGNFDLFLPFIEKSIQLLNNKGRMGFIAPSLWRFNEYGEGLRRMLHQGRHLDRWVDFGSFQVFDEVITYTALQFYNKAPQDTVHFVFAPNGSLADAPDWHDPNWSMTYSELPANGDPWIFVPRKERALINRLNSECKRLDDAEVSTSISQGLISGAFTTYVMRQTAPNKYAQISSSQVHEEITLEDEITIPILSGPDVGRYYLENTGTRIIFPYENDNDHIQLIAECTLISKFPKCWDHLKCHEESLRKRDSGKMNNERWYSYSRTQNLDKQKTPKVLIAGTAKRIEAVVDSQGEFAANDKRVYSVFPRDQEDLHFLCAVLNSRIVDFIFRRIARPKMNGYFDIETQFLGPLPIPSATPEEKEKVSELGESLQELHTKKHNKLKALEKRFEVCPEEKHDEDWLWPEVKTVAHWKTQAPRNLSSQQKTQWAKEKRDGLIDKRWHTIQARLSQDANLVPDFSDGELFFSIDGVPIVDHVFVEENMGEQILVHWRHIARTTSITEKSTAKRLTDLLRAPRVTDNPALADQLCKLDVEVGQLDEEIAGCEQKMDSLLFDLYQLSDDERRLVQS